MQHDFAEIELAFDSVSSQMQSMCTAYLSLADGKIYYLDDATGIFDDLPDDFETSDQYIEIPHKNDLNLGRDLVYEFINKNAPNLSDNVRQIFSRKGAYQRFKTLLVRHELLDQWHNYEQTETEFALKRWCNENSIELNIGNPNGAG